MLRDLHVRNLAVLAEAMVEFGRGLNVLTGETGAGKSIVVDSLALLSGARASGELIRSGSDTLTVTGRFEPRGDGWLRVLAEAGVVAGESLVIRREVSRLGPNRVFVNDQPVTLRLLGELAPHLLNIHGQREEIALRAAQEQRDWLDASGGEAASELLRRVAACHQRYLALAEHLERLSGDERLRLERLDLLQFQLREIDAAGLAAGEEDELRREREVLRHAEAILRALGGAQQLLADEDGAVAERLQRARQLLDEVRAWEPGAASWVSELDELGIRVDELSVALARRGEEVELDPGRLNQVEDRLALLERLFRKYGPSTADILEQRRRLAIEVESLEVDEKGRERLARDLLRALDEYREEAAELSRSRREWGDRLARRVRSELADLALAKARFHVRQGARSREGSPLMWEGAPAEFGPHGVDQVAYEFSPNPGEELRPLAKVASGGELSRLHLAVRLAVRGEGRAPPSTLVFDEVDAGVGGRQAAALGRKLQRLAAGGQVLAVTHLPQVASHADRHLQVRKRVSKGRTFVEVRELDDESRVEEIARMLAGRRITDLSRSHARELIAAAGE